MKTLLEYINEGNASLNQHEKVAKEKMDYYWKTTMRDTHISLDWDLDHIPNEMRNISTFKGMIRWMFDIIPEDTHEFIGKYFFEKLFIKTKTKVADKSIFDELYAKYKSEIDKAFAEDTDAKKKLREKCPEYYQNTESKFK